MRNLVNGRVYLLLAIFVFAGSASAQQNSRNNDYTPDNALKSNARINPMTQAMELSIPVSGYQGRAGNDLPVVLDYTSKVWQIDFLYIWETQEGDTKTDTRPRYAKTSSAGWSTNLGVPRINYPHNLYKGSTFGNPTAGHPYNPGDCLSNCETENYSVYYIKRLEIVMPGGSTVEFRKDDTAHFWGTAQGSGTADMTGVFLSVDGSRMRLEIIGNQTTLFMPDGSRYLFGQGFEAYTKIDRHGNKLTYNAATKQWTDTIGRIIEDPVPVTLDDIEQTGITIGDNVASFPSKDGGTYDVTFSWRYLKDPNGGESGLTDPTQELRYLSDQGCQGDLNRWLSTTENPQPHLFKTGTLYQWDHFTRVCHPISWSGLDWWPGPRFNPKVLTKITLPNGQKYEFKYNIFGEIEKIIYPTGAYERFLYGEVPAVLPAMSGHYDQANRGVIERWVSAKGDGTDELHWTYSGWLTVEPDGMQTQRSFVTDTPYNDQLYGFGNPYLGRSYEDKTLSSSNQLLRRKLNGYETTGGGAPGTTGVPFRDTRPNKEITIVFEPGATSALATMTETVYDTTGNSDPTYFSSLNPKQTKTHNYVVLDLATAQTGTIATISAMFSNSTLATVTEMDYLYDANYKARNIIGLVTETRVKDAAGNVKAKSQVFYDEVGTYPLLTDVSSTRWEDLNTNYRGLVTTTKSWSDIANNLFVTSHAQYDRLGNARRSWDGNGNLSQVEYSSTYDHAYPTKTISPDPDGGGAITPLETTVVYDYNTGLPTSTTDANGQTTQMQYNDPLLRPTKTVAPNGHQTITEYGAGTSELTRFVKSRSQIDETNWKEAYSWFDGLGRAYKSQSVDSSGDVFTESLFDEFGRPWKSSNPYRTGETKLWTENFYDTAGRVFKVKTPDGAEVETAWGLATTGNQIGTVVTVTDQAEKQRRSITNALGQLKRVDEPNASNQLGTIDNPNQWTGYTYDLLNNLITVNQGEQTRSFTYDTLSRLKSATNPESGTINYAYDSNGNLTSKLDARSITTAYTYDALNRVTLRSYTNEPSGSETPDVTYFYDNQTNAKGKLTKVSSSVSTTEYTAFDILGRVTQNKQTTDGITFGNGTTDSPMTYIYNLSGALMEQQYPSGRVVKNTIDNDGDLSMVQSKKNSTSGYWSYANSFTYNAAGAVTSMQLGNGRWESTTFNSRLQPTQIALGTVQNGTDKLKLDYGYGTTENNGNVLNQTITVPTIGAHTGFTATQTYTYDSLNRIKDATENITGQTPPSWKQTFTYDRYGNRNFDEANTTTLPKECNGNTEVCEAIRPIVNPSVSTANNRLNGYTFDNSGNTAEDAQERTFIYDAENKQVKVLDSEEEIIGEYFYDGDGKRIKKYVPSTGEMTVFVYDAAGKLVAEYSTVVASPQDAKVAYLTNDHLGSPRINTDQNGTVTARHDYHPFGEEISTSHRIGGLGYTTDSVRKQFTGYERDNETDLDFAQARYLNSGVGRFSSPDDFRNDTMNIDPQSWNLYVFVRNNPLTFVDPTGEKATVKTSYDEKTGITTISISASFAVYGASGQNVSQEDLAKHATLLAEGIAQTYNTAFEKDGRGYVVQTDIDVQVFGSEEAAMGSGADNLVELGNSTLVDNEGESVRGAVFNRPGESFDRMAVEINRPVTEGGSGLGSFMAGPEAYRQLYGHEFGHLLGTRDQATGFMQSGGMQMNLQSQDFEAIFGRGRVQTRSPVPPGAGLKPNPMGLRYAAGTSGLYAIGGMNVLGSNASGFLMRRSQGRDLYRWVARNK